MSSNSGETSIPRGPDGEATERGELSVRKSNRKSLLCESKIQGNLLCVTKKNMSKVD